MPRAYVSLGCLFGGRSLSGRLPLQSAVVVGRRQNVFRGMLIVSAFSVLCIPVPTLAAGLPSRAAGTGDLLARWPADTTANDEVMGYHGTLVGGASHGDGYCGCAFRLDGADDYVDVENTRILPDTFTVALWVNVARNPADNDYFFIVRFQHETQFFLAYTNYTQAARPQLVATFRGAAQQWHIPVDGAVFLNQWAHLAVAYNGGGKADSTSYAVYLNGERLSFEGALGLGLVGGSCNDNAFGADPVTGPCDQNYHFFAGGLDDIRVYAGALSAELVRNLYLETCTLPGCAVPVQHPSWSAIKARFR